MTDLQIQNIIAVVRANRLPPKRYKTAHGVIPSLAAKYNVTEAEIRYILKKNGVSK